MCVKSWPQGAWGVMAEGTEDDQGQILVIQGGGVIVVENRKINISWSHVDKLDEVLLSLGSRY